MSNLLGPNAQTSLVNLQVEEVRAALHTRDRAALVLWTAEQATPPLPGLSTRRSHLHPSMASVCQERKALLTPCPPLDLCTLNEARVAFLWKGTAVYKDLRLLIS